MYLKNYFSPFCLLVFLAFQAVSCSNNSEDKLPQVSVESISIAEGNETKSVDIRMFLSEAATENVSIIFSTRERTAIAGEDFVEQKRVSTSIAAGEIDTRITVEILGDRTFESEEIFFIVFDEVVGAEPAEVAVQITIENDDADPNGTLTGPDSPEQYAGMNLIWRDEFDGSQVDGSKWFQEFGDNWFNNELQTYTNEGRNVSVRNGNLVIEARQEPSPYGGSNPYTSARLITQDKFEFKYGRVDFRAAMPEGQGIWPALWTLGGNIDEVSWPSCGEIDVLEMIGGGTENVAHNAMHWQGATAKQSTSNSYVLSEGSLHGEFHVYSIIWTEKSITFLIDGIERDEVNIEASHMTEFHQPHFLIMNVAVGGDWPGSPDETTVFPQQMIVDYVRVFQNQ